MIIHAFTSRREGDMKKSAANRNKAIRQIFGDDRPLLTVPQAHTNKVGVDALVTNRKGVVVGVFVADCVPILLADRKNKAVAAVHAGWKGTLGAITTNTIGEMKKLGSDPADLVVWIGPHIGLCNYDVPEERAQKFLQMFNNDPKVASFFENKWHVDLGWANYRQLVEAGVKPDSIDAPPTCTYCRSDTYFSFRRDAKETFGEMMGVIGFV